MELQEARRIASEKGLDLVEVGPDANPPVVKVMDWGKYRFAREKKAKESKKKHHVIEIKEIKFSPTIDSSDFERKTEKIKQFIEKGKKVKVTVRFKARQLRRPELGQNIIDNVIEKVKEVAVVEGKMGGLEGRQMVVVLAPKPKK